MLHCENMKVEDGCGRGSRQRTESASARHEAKESSMLSMFRSSNACVTSKNENRQHMESSVIAEKV